MELEIAERQNDIMYDVPSVSFPAYQEYKDKAATVAEYIDSMEVTEESVKEVKETLAKARKLTERLSRVRIDMKKDLLKNYAVFESQVKEIISIIDSSDEKLRTKVKELEEKERMSKKDLIHQVWDKRMITCPIIERLMPEAFERWLTPKHLNKSMSMSSVEKDMTEWIRKTMGDIALVTEMGEEYLVAYAQCNDIGKAIETVNRQKEVTKTVRKANAEENIAYATFVICGTKDIALTERLLNENKINYRKE